MEPGDTGSVPTHNQTSASLPPEGAGDTVVGENLRSVNENSHSGVSQESPSRTITESIDMPERKPPLILPNEPDFHPTANGRNGWKFAEIYEAGTELGRGAFGAVYIGTHKFASEPDEDGDDFAPDWKRVAIKRTRPNSLDLRDGREIKHYGQLERRCQEVKTLIRLQEGSATMSPVLFLYEIFMSGKDFYMVTELLEQELDDWRIEADMFTEKMAIDICRNILLGIDFMHSRKVIHRDIKLQNIMFRKKGDFNTLKIVDFGLARVLEEGETARDFCGSIGYISPVSKKLGGGIVITQKLCSLALLTIF